MAKNPYNGFSAAERSAKSRARRNGEAPYKDWKGQACSICGDASPEAKVKGHSENYAKPYKWYEPDVYTVCRACHVRVHARFRNPERWRAYLEFVRRGWYGREVTSRQLSKRMRLGERYAWLPATRSNPRVERDPWWERLSTDSPALGGPAAPMPGVLP